MRQGIFSTSAFSQTSNSRFFATICGARSMAANPGCCCREKEAAGEATSSGLPSIRLMGQGKAFNTRQTMVLIVAAAAWNFSALLMAESPGRLPSLFPIRLRTERSMSTRTAIFLSAEKGTLFTAFVRATRRMEASRQLLTGLP